MSLRDQYADGCNLDARIALHQRFGVNAQSWWDWVRERLAIPGGARVLELGCGTARLWVESAGRLPAWSVCLTDASPGMLAEAVRAVDLAHRATPGGPRVAFAFAVADAESLPVRSEGFDAVIANHMLYHVADRPRALREISRVLVPGGRLFAATVGEEHLAPLDDWLAELGVAPTALGREMTAAFTLENGGAQLASVFASVETSVYPDELRVTEVEPIVAYLRSIVAGGELPAGPLARLRAALEARIAAEGAIVIPKATGIFVARKPA